MSIFDEIYYETHELTLQEEYLDFLLENNLNENDFSLSDYRGIL